jgi:CDP-Glycerol:Poly(glycerophosphate) glycerophosphotransferase
VLSSGEIGFMRTAMKTIGYYLRYGGNLHYFASIKPYLDHFLSQGEHQNHIVVRALDPGHERIPEYAGYTHLVTDACDLDAYDLVLTPTFLHPEERSPRTPAVQIFHGMSDKSFTYERDFSDYLLCLCVGQRQVDRLLQYPPNRGLHIALVGYPKFDSVPEVSRLFENNKKTLIYCPTWRKGGLSSVERFLEHREIVEQIAQDYNLIVKPHPNIFNPHREYFDPAIVERLEQLEQIAGVRLIRSGNVMPWFAQSDLFVGDISASGYEWLYFSRPMAFLNPQPGVLQPSQDINALTYLWQCGDVCADIRGLRELIAKNLQLDHYRKTREAVLHHSVFKPRESGATQRGVKALEALLCGKRTILSTLSA